MLCTIHARARVARTTAKCVMSIDVTRNGMLLFTTLFSCLYARYLLSVNGCNESLTVKIAGLYDGRHVCARAVPGDFFVNQGSIFKNRVLVSVLHHPVYTLVHAFYRKVFLIFSVV